MKRNRLWLVPGFLLLAQAAWGSTTVIDPGSIDPNSATYLETLLGRFSIQIPANSMRHKSNNALVTHAAVNIAAVTLTGNGVSGGGGITESGFGPDSSTASVVVVKGRPQQQQVGIGQPHNPDCPEVITNAEHLVKHPGHPHTGGGDVHDTEVIWKNAVPAQLILGSPVTVPMQLGDVSMVDGDSVITLPGQAGTYRALLLQRRADLTGFPNGSATITARTTSVSETKGFYSSSLTIKPTWYFAPSAGTDTLYYTFPAPVAVTGAPNWPFTLDKDLELPAVGLRGMLAAAAMLLLTGMSILVWRRRQEGSAGA